MQIVEIFYSFHCPYSYLAIDQLSQIDQKFDVKVLWQPFSHKAAGKNFQSNPLPQDRASCIREDVVRLARKSNMPLVMKNDWPEGEYDLDRSTRGAVIAADMEIILPYNIKVFHRVWGEGENPDDHNFFIDLCDDLDVDLNEFSARINTADTRERVRGIYKRGRKLGVFDTPMILIGEERFYGMDRVSAAEERLSEMGLRKTVRAA